MSPGCSLDLVGRFRYMAKEQNTIHKRGVIPYFGGGGGVSRYASLSRLVAAGQDGAFYNPVPSVFSDRKSTRLNSSHANISYAVFCLKKKN